ncbi:POP5 ribonuclease P/MRP subunit [Oratosquilla oratoria]|uniref:POP5 ribonuclease P/MRP subunit n=1 Tax=Oratosquilla oratoria TaxID=337810 RepID=UPI003F7579F3
MGLRVKYFNSSTRIAILSANKGSHLLVCSALPIITQIGSYPASLKTLLVTATMKLSFTFVKANHKNMLSSVHKSMKQSDTKEEFERRVQQSRIFESQVQ